MTTPLISVIIPAYNHESYVYEAVSSVLQQEGVTLEVIVIDDGSSDGTLSILSALRDPRLRLYHQTNQGSQRTINRGLELANGDYLAILNSDDRFHPQRLKRLLEASDDKGFDMVLSDLCLIDAAGSAITDPTLVWLRWYADLKANYVIARDPAHALLRGNWGITTSNFFLNRRVYERIGGLHPFKYVLDYEYLLRAATTPGLKLGFLIGEALLDYRLHGANAILENPLLANLETDFLLRQYMPRIFGQHTGPAIAHLHRIKRNIVKLDRYRWRQHNNDMQVAHLRELLATTQSELDTIRLSRSYRLGKAVMRPLYVVKYVKSKLSSADAISTHDSNHLPHLPNGDGEDTILLSRKRSISASKFLRVLDIAWWQRHYHAQRQIPRARDVMQLQHMLYARLDNIKLVSFDVFDTLLERLIDPPNYVKLISGRALVRHLRIHFGKEWMLPELLSLRASVEARLRRERQADNKDHELRFSDLATELARLLTGKANPALAAWIVAEELRAEADCIYVKPGVTALLDGLRQLGLRIIAISDMYLEQAHVETLLKQMGLFKYIDQLYVSSDTGIGKHTGRLFKHVVETERVAATAMLHIGDNHHSDAMMPTELGIPSIWFDDSVNNRRRAILRGHAWLATKNPYWRGRHLLQLIAPAHPQGFAFDLGFSYLGPLFCTFIQGVIEKVRQHRVERLFFLAREGELFLRLFEYLAPQLMEPEEIPMIAYLYVSRKSTAPAALAKGLTYENSLAPLYNPKQRGITSICQTFEIAPEMLRAVAMRHGYEIDQPIYDWQSQRYRDLIADPELQSLVTSCGGESRALLADYLTQHGFFSAKRVGLVDIGWNGSSQHYFQDAYGDRADYPHVFGLYMGWVHGIRHGFDPNHNTLFGLMYDVRRKNFLEDGISRFEELFEEGARALHPSTMGYKRGVDGRVVPIFKDDSAPDRQVEILMNPQIEAYRAGIMAFAARFVHAIRMTGYSFEEIRPFMLTLLERVVTQPTFEEAQALMQLTHSEDFGSAAVMHLQHDRLHLRDLLTPRIFLNKLRHSNWLYGSGRLTGMPGLNSLLRYLDLTRFYS